MKSRTGPCYRRVLFPLLLPSCHEQKSLGFTLAPALPTRVGTWPFCRADGPGAVGTLPPRKKLLLGHNGCSGIPFPSVPMGFRHLNALRPTGACAMALLGAETALGTARQSRTWPEQLQSQARAWGGRRRSRGACDRFL